MKLCGYHKKECQNFLMFVYQHIKAFKNIFKENELEKNSVVSKMEITALDGNNTVGKTDVNNSKKADSEKENMGLTNWKNSPDGL